MAYKPEEIQAFKHHIEKIDQNLLDVEANAFEFLRKNPSNKKWYQNLTFILEEQAGRLEALLRFEEKIEKLLELVKSFEQSAIWRQTIIDILEQILNTLLPMNLKFSRIFGDDFDALIKAIMSLKVNGPPERKDKLDVLVETFIKMSLIGMETSNMPLILHKIGIELNAIGFEVKILMENEHYPVDTPEHQKGLESFTVILDTGASLVSLFNELEKAIAETVNHFMQLNPELIPLLKLSSKTVDLGKPTIDEFTKLKDEYDKIKLEKKSLRSTNKKKRTWFDRWILVSNDVRELLSLAFDLLASESVTFRGPDGNCLARMTDNTSVIFNFITKQLFGIFGEGARKLWTSISGLETNYSSDSEQFKKIKSLFDDLDKAYTDNFLNVKQSIKGFRAQANAIVEEISTLRQLTGHGILSRNALNIHDKHQAISYQFRRERQSIQEFIRHISELIAALNQIIGSK